MAGAQWEQRRMTRFGLPESLEELREGGFMELYDTAALRGFTPDLIMRTYLARAESTQTLLWWRDFLIAINDGDFDWLLKDSTGQSYN
jgi:hypothetical protein